MNKLTLLIVGSVVGALALGLVITGITYNNSFVTTEAAITAADSDLKNVDSQVVNTLQTQGVTSAEYANQVKEAIHIAIEGRYGKTGSQAAFQFLQESNPTIDPSLYKKLADAAEGGYNQFAAVQRRKIDLVRTYKTDAQTFPGVLFAKALGYPSKPWAELGKVVVSSNTQDAFKTGTRNAVNPFGK